MKNKKIKRITQKSNPKITHEIPREKIRYGLPATRHRKSKPKQKEVKE